MSYIKLKSCIKSEIEGTKISALYLCDNIMTVDSFAIGDFVEIVGDHAKAGKRGYIFGPPEEYATNFFVGVDEYFADDTPPPLPANIPADCLKTIRKQNTLVKTRVCDFISGEFSCLGMVASSYSSGESKINPDSPHGKLARPPAKDLPGPHRDDRSFKDKETADIFSSVYRGNFSIQWLHVFREIQLSKAIDKQCSQPECVQQWMLDERKPAYFFCVSIVKENGDEIRIGDHVIGPLANGEPGSEYLGDWRFGALTNDQQIALVLRVTHMLLRVTGCDFGFSSLPTFRQIFGHYNVSGWWVETRDLATLIADILVQTDQSANAICCSLATDLVDALGACKQLDMSVQVLEQAYAEYAPKLSDMSMLFELREKLGHVCCQNFEFDKAEEVLHRGLYDSLRFCTVAPRYVSNVIVRLIRTYHDRNVTERNETGTVVDVYLLLEAVLHIMGMTAEKTTLSLEILDAKYRDVAGAEVALDRAFRARSVKAFRAEICSWKAKGAKLKFVPMDRAARTGDALRKAAKNTARERALSQCTVPRLKCKNPGCADEFVEFAKLSRCSKCKAVLYCSRQCQVADWKIHKRSCFQREAKIEK
jgi:hypothetical protein